MTRAQRGFGELIRAARKAAKLTMGDVAAELGVSVVYVSDVERANRPPFRPELIERLAVILRVDAAELHRAAGEARGAFKVSAEALPTGPAREFVAGLARGEQYPDDFWRELVELAEKHKGGK